MRFYGIKFLKKTAGRLLPISRKILDISLVLSAIRQPEKAVHKQFTMFSLFLWKYLTLFRMDFFGAAQKWGVGKEISCNE